MRSVMRKLVCVVAVLGLWQSSAVPQTRETKPRETKPLVAVIYAEWCPMCQQLKPVLALMNERYDGKVRFVRLDMTSEKTAAEAERKASEAGLKSFFKENKEKTSLVIIQDASGHEVFRAYHDYDFDHYAKVLDWQLRTAKE
jgi:thiol-disulfide isomerase/thioredoxin